MVAVTRVGPRGGQREVGGLTVETARVAHLTSREGDPHRHVHLMQDQQPNEARSALSGEHYALEVRGDSMVEAGILDGDMALIQRNETAETGDIVVALIDEEEATLKRFRRRGASIALEPANTSYEVRILPPNRVRIQGKLIGLYRKY